MFESAVSNPHHGRDLHSLLLAPFSAPSELELEKYQVSIHKFPDGFEARRLTDILLNPAKRTSETSEHHE